MKSGGIFEQPWDIADDFYTSHNTTLPYDVAWKARTICLEKIHGSYEESYRLVPSFVEMVANTNPGSEANYTYGRNDNCFESMMISFDAPVQGLLSSCRGIIGLDACHLTGNYGGCLMAATALDAQNGIVPLALQVCKNECGENWYLSLKQLKPKIESKQGINFIYDR